ncbi:MAG: protein kinase [Planctomycetales bacterium]|nr:protein kinase [Planctomycetales bacterium]
MMTATACPSAEQLKSLSLGELPEQQSDALISHLQHCERCRGELETVEDSQDSLIAALRGPDDSAAFDAEPECQRAMAQALGALAEADQRPATSDWGPHMPQTIGEYEVVRPLGRGGMGSVYLARHTKLGRDVALKILASHRLADPRMRERFAAEMRAVGRLSHPNIVTAHDAREVGGTAVLVTEFIDGFDLQQIVQRTGPLAIADACEIARQVAVALEYTSSQGFVHRDVKPSNIMLSQTGEVKLLDLGLARLQDGQGEHSEITRTGQAMGTADYLAPEQVTDSRAVDVRADIYALGCTLFHLLSGQAPFADEQHITAFAKMTAHVSTAAPNLKSVLPDAPQTLVELLQAMLAKSPEDRPQDPRHVAERLSAHCRGHRLQSLVERARTLPPQASLPPNSGRELPRSTAPTQPFLRRSVPLATAVAAGLLGILLGMCLSLIIVITNPDGTQTLIELAKGSRVEIRETAPQAEMPLTKMDSQARLHGVWQVTWRQQGANRVDGSQLGEDYFAFDEQNYYALVRGHSKFGSIKVSPVDGQSHIDLRDAESSMKSLGLYRFLANGQLQICLDQSGGDARPSSFESDPNSQNILLLTLVRRGDFPQSPVDAARLAKGQSPEFSKFVLALAAHPATIDKPSSPSSQTSEALPTQPTSIVQLKRIGLAFHNYHDVYHYFPGSANERERAANAGSEQKIYPFSWRVAILPFVEQAELYEQYRFDQPWDSEHNLTLLEKMPDVYRSPYAPHDQPPGHTNYLGFSGEQSALGANGGLAARDFRDGFTNTLLIAETQHSVPWTKPEDLPFKGYDDAQQAVPFDNQALNYLTADGAVHNMPQPIDYDLLGRLITRAGGEFAKASRALAD